MRSIRYFFIKISPFKNILHCTKWRKWIFIVNYIFVKCELFIVLLFLNACSQSWILHSSVHYFYNPGNLGNICNTFSCTFAASATSLSNINHKQQAFIWLFQYICNPFFSRFILYFSFNVLIQYFRSEEPSDVVHLNDETFKPFLKKKKHVLVMFYAPW